MSAPAADRYQATLEVLAARSAARLVAVWDWATPWDFDAEGRFHTVAKPIATAAAASAVSTTIGYARTTNRAAAIGTPSPLIIQDAAARMFSPFEVVSKNLADGTQWVDAIAAGREYVQALGSDVVISSARQAAAEVLPNLSPWVRRVNSGACPWCLNLSGVRWNDPGSATFGHKHCKCVAVPAADAGDHNDRIRADMGWNQEAKNVWKVRDQRARLNESIRTANKRRSQAIAEQARETDPARRERLSIREQEWETRAERAAERLRLLESRTAA